MLIHTYLYIYICTPILKRMRLPRRILGDEMVCRIPVSRIRSFGVLLPERIYRVPRRFRETIRHRITITGVMRTRTRRAVESISRAIFAFGRGSIISFPPSIFAKKTRDIPTLAAVRRNNLGFHSLKRTYIK